MNDYVNMGWMAEWLMDKWTHCSAGPMKRSSAEVIGILKGAWGEHPSRWREFPRKQQTIHLLCQREADQQDPGTRWLLRILQLRLKESCFETFHGRTQTVLFWNLARINTVLSDILLTTESFSSAHSINSSSWNIHSAFKNNWQMTYDPVKLQDHE